MTSWRTTAPRFEGLMVDEVRTRVAQRWWLSTPYCGLEGLLDAAVEPGGADGVAGSAAAGAECEVGAADSDFGGSGAVVMALSGFRRWSLLGPKPNLISARESGTVLLCHPLSAW